MLEYKTLLASISSIGIFAVLLKLIRFIRTKNLKKSYFKDKTVLITGASSGLGKGIAEELYPLGAQVILCARNVDELNKVKKSLMKEPGKEPEVLGLDVSSKLDVVKPKIDSLIAKYGQIDILINNAGVSFRGESFTTSDEVFQKIMDVNFFGVIRLTNLVVSHMVKHNEENSEKKSTKRREFSIVNVGSVQSYLGLPYRSAYCASKHALLAYSDSLRAELYRHRNISIINTQPGYIDTNVSINALTGGGVKNNMNDDDHRSGFSPKYVAQVMINSILERKNEVLIAILLHRAAIWLRFFFPNVFFSIMYLRAKSTFNKKFQ